MTYIPGDHWKICDRCGFKCRSSATFRTWDGLYVCREDYETRHPQDFVKGRRDSQIVPNPRPEQVNNFIGPLTTALSAAAATSATTLTVESSARFEPGDTIGIIAESGTVRRTVDGVPSATSITLTAALGTTAASGSTVINYSAVAEPDIG